MFSQIISLLYFAYISLIFRIIKFLGYKISSFPEWNNSKSILTFKFIRDGVKPYDYSEVIYLYKTYPGLIYNRNIKYWNIIFDIGNDSLLKSFFYIFIRTHNLSAIFVSPSKKIKKIINFIFLKLYLK